MLKRVFEEEDKSEPESKKKMVIYYFFLIVANKLQTYYQNIETNRTFVKIEY